MGGLPSPKKRDNLDHGTFFHTSKVMHFDVSKTELQSHCLSAPNIASDSNGKRDGCPVGESCMLLMDVPVFFSKGTLPKINMKTY